MENFIFWKYWNRTEKFLLTTLFIGVLTATGLYFYSDYKGLESSIHWTEKEELTTVTVPYSVFNSNLFQFETEILNYIGYKDFGVTTLKLNPIYGLLTLILLGLFLAYVFAYSTTLKAIYYFGAVVLSLFYFTSLNLKELNIFGQTNNEILILISFIFCLISYYFYGVKNNSSFSTRFISFLGYIGFVYFIAASGSTQNISEVNFHLYNYSYILLFLLFLSLVVYSSLEIVLLFVYLSAFSKRPERRAGFIQFALLTLLYLASIFLIYMYNRGKTDISLYGLNAYVMLITGSIIGIWGIEKRFEKESKQNKKLIQFGYVILLLVTFSFISNANFYAQTTIKESLEDFICVGYFSFGVLFFIYVSLNFGVLLHQKKQIYKVIFQPTQMLMYHVWIMGIIGSAALVFQANSYPYHQAISGYFSSVADTYYHEKKYDLAEVFYRYSRFYDETNLRPNYSMASTIFESGKLKESISFFDLSNEKWPSEQAFVAQSNLLEADNKYFDAIFTLKDGIKEFPNSAFLHTKLALLYKKTDVIDTTYYHFLKARENSSGKSYSLQNMYTFALKHNLTKELTEISKERKNFSTDMNIKAIESAEKALKMQFNKTIPFFDTTNLALNDTKFSYLFNYSMNNIMNLDSSYHSYIEQLKQHEKNYKYIEQLIFLQANYSFHHGNPTLAREHLATLASGNSELNGYYYNLLGKWMLMQKNHYLAQKYFLESYNLQYREAFFNLAFTSTLLNDTITTDLWKTFGQLNEQTNKISEVFLNIIQLSPSNLTDDELLYYCTFINPTFSHEAISLIENEQIKLQLQVIRVQDYFQTNQIDQAGALIGSLKQYPLDDYTHEKLLLYEGIHNTKTGKIKETLKLLEQITVNKEIEPDKLLLKALCYKHLKNIELAKKEFENVLTLYPFYEEGIIEATTFFNDQNEIEKSYTLLINAIRLNEQSSELLKQYIRTATELRYLNFAEQSMETLKKLISENDYSEFEQYFKQKKAEIEAIEQEWN